MRPVAQISEIPSAHHPDVAYPSLPSKLMAGMAGVGWASGRGGGVVFVSLFRGVISAFV